MYAALVSLLSALYPLVRPLLFALDAERAHGLGTFALRLLSRLSPAPSLPLSLPPAASSALPPSPAPAPALPPSLSQTLWGLTFPSPIGLAAGLDKGEVLAPAFFSLGFGFVEIGSITPRPQPGNPRPRLFRLKPERALVNRMGFNNAGMAAVAARLGSLARQPGPLGINLGKNKDTPNDRAQDDYVAAFTALAPFAGYVAINVSSPNTPGLRALQAAGELSALVSAVAAARDSLTATLGRRVPLLVKLSPDEPDERLDAIADAAVGAGADGLIATNTTLSRAGVEQNPLSAQAGGLSGAPLRERAQRVCARLFLRVGAKVPIVGVGGIATAEDAYARLRAGASLVQVYTAFIYEGPGLPQKLTRGLGELLRRDGLTLAQAVGRDAEKVQSLRVM